LTNCDSHGFERDGFLKSREINAIASRSTHGPRSADPPPALSPCDKLACLRLKGGVKPLGKTQRFEPRRAV
jgi:hypothetical protein